MRSLRDIRLVALALTASMLTAACVSQDDPGLTLTKVNANLVFGVEEEPEEVPLPIEAAFERFTPPPGPKATVRKPRPNLTPVIPPPPPPACPDAEGFPEQEATFEIPRGQRPVEGLYRYRVSIGKRTIEEQEDGSTVAIDNLELVSEDARVIRNVRDLERPEWSVNPAERPGRQVYEFEEVRLLPESRLEVGESGDDAGDRYLVTKWQVDTDAAQAATPSGTGAGGLAGSRRDGDRERGMALMSIIVIDENGDEVNSLQTFEPLNGLLVLPMPITSGEQYQTAAVDEDGRTISHDGTVGKRERMNACGEPLEGWRVDAVQTFQTGASSAINYDYTYLLAPQFGSIFLYEKIHNQLNNSVIEFALNAKAPEPLPDNGLPS